LRSRDTHLRAVGIILWKRFVLDRNSQWHRSCPSGFSQDFFFARHHNVGTRRHLQQSIQYYSIIHSNSSTIVMCLSPEQLSALVQYCDHAITACFSHWFSPTSIIISNYLKFKIYLLSINRPPLYAFASDANFSLHAFPDFRSFTARSWSPRCLRNPERGWSDCQYLFIIFVVFEDW